MSMETKRPADSGAPAEHYERRDANIPALAQFAFWLGVTIFAAVLGMKCVFDYFAKVQKLGPPASPFENARVLPPSPRLQVEPHVELQNYREAQREALSTYGWVDKPNGVVRIPIDRAMDLILQHGLAARSAGGGTVPGLSVDATRSTQATTPPEPLDRRPAAASARSSP